MTAFGSGAWREQFLGLAAELSDRDPGVMRAMTLVLDDPAAYLDRHDETAERLDAGTGGAAASQLPWLALVDRLLAALCAVEIDWRADRDDVVWQLEQLRVYAALPAAIRGEIAHVGEAAAHECLLAIAHLVARAGHRLALIDLDADSYVVTLLDSARYERTTKVADAIGAVLRDIREHEPDV